jgi:hypothetical protein
VDRVGSLTALDADDLAGLAELMVAIDREPLAVLEPALLDLGARLGPERLRLALPAITRGWEQRGLAHKVTRLWDLGFRRWQVAGLAGFAHLDVAGSLTLGPPGSAGVGEGGQQGAPALELTADWTLSTLNRAAAWALLAMGCRGVTLSPEDGLANLSELLARFAEEATIVVYQDTPLFISETCPWASLAGGCPGAARCDADQMRLGSHHGAEVWAINDRCRSVVVNAAPFCIVGRLDALVAAGVRHLRADFIWRAYAPEELRDRWRELRAGRPPGRFHEAGILRCL